MIKEAILKNIELYIDNILKYNKCNNLSDLLADGVNIYTKEPVKWYFNDKEFAIVSDFVATQTFLKTLVAFSNYTENKSYYNQAVKITKSFFNKFVDENGLFNWGGHRFIDLKTLELSGPSGKNYVHELKSAYPYYEFLAAVDKEKTVRYLNQLWTSHVYNWNNMDMNRHGNYETKYNDIISTKKPNNFNVVDPSILPLFKETEGLTFLNIATDLMYGGFCLSKITRNNLPYEWSHYLAYQYELGKNKDTGLPVYQYSIPLKRESTTDDNQTFSKYGDRVQRQFGDEFGSIAYEPNKLFSADSTMGETFLLQLHIANNSNDKKMLSWLIERIKIYYKYAYDEANNTFKPMFNDGKDLTGYVFKKNGYSGKKGKILERIKMNGELFLSLVNAYIINSDQTLGNYIENSLIKMNLIDSNGVNAENNCADELILYALVQLYKHNKNTDALKLSDIIAENIINNKFINGYFIDNNQYIYSKINDGKALILLHYLSLYKNNISVPEYLSVSGFIHGEYYENGEIIDIKDYSHIYTKKLEN